MSQSQADQQAQRAAKSKFIKSGHFSHYKHPKMVHAAQDLVNINNLSEEGFLGVQAVLMLNGIL